MAKVCVEIEIDSETGEVTVGVCPPEEETGEPKDYMQPVESIEAALSQAQELLAGNEAGSTDQETPQDQMQEDPAAGEAAFSGGFNQIRNGGLNGRG